MAQATFQEASYRLVVEAVRFFDKIDTLTEEILAPFLQPPLRDLPLDLQESEDWQGGPIDAVDGMPPDHP